VVLAGLCLEAFECPCDLLDKGKFENTFLPSALYVLLDGSYIDN